MTEVPIELRSASEIAAEVRAGRVTARAVVEASLARIARDNPKLGAFTAVTAERALATADRVDAGPKGPLAGVPFAVKNLFDIAGVTTLAGSRINRDLPPASHDATLVTRLEAAGAVLVGALNMGEYAYDFTGENVHDGPSRNPHDLPRMSGGSSGGSGSAVGGGLVNIFRLLRSTRPSRAAAALQVASVATVPLLPIFFARRSPLQRLLSSNDWNTAVSVFKRVELVASEAVVLCTSLAI